MKLKIGVVADTHLQKVTEEFREIHRKYLSDKDLILHAGDVVSTEILDFLGKKDIKCVHGNMDPFEVRKRTPAKEVIELGLYRVGLIHGWGPTDGLEQRIISQFEDVDVIVYGHSHRPTNRWKDGVLLFNPGTTTGFSLSGLHTIGLLEIDHGIHGEIITL